MSFKLTGEGGERRVATPCGERYGVYRVKRKSRADREAPREPSVSAAIFFERGGAPPEYQKSLVVVVPRGALVGNELLGLFADIRLGPLGGILDPLGLNARIETLGLHNGVVGEGSGILGVEDLG